ncbi:hypothetical protein OAU10_03290 [Saprospiraceae bacterium]|nr:hypothetical protein [Saprospiraceae bacterium]MDC3210500.1 hypothetical protein [Saprospiraceae bacterium]MDG1435705.1 hypothetical protein [Saprospiraceae bacterium]
MATEGLSTAIEFKGNYIIYYALVAGQVLIALIVSFLTIEIEKSFSWEMENPLHLIAPILMLSASSISSFLFTKKMEEARNVKGFYKKLKHYRAAIIMRSAFLEGVNLVCIIFYLLESNYFFLLLFFLGFGAFLLVRPSADNFKEQYRLTEEERKIFRKMTS